ncbi:CidA/LrgA family protein [Novisyntrophococcus fermenticellae]|uniref:CidA/LrgA family protein n=1 Tax=Novisyntrophococcus fermenticellae TaxID=2068655 RepID=UPI001E5FF926|nr:CidA/LrgA family protein [Novisyntrophococcus fermenticellae]
MKYIKQFAIILSMTFLGELLHHVIPLPIPGSIYGLILLLLSLITGIVKTDQIKETSTFLIEIMPMMFIPAAAGLLTSWGSLKPVLLPVCVITIVSTVAVMSISGRVTQCIIRKEKNK